MRFRRPQPSRGCKVALDAIAAFSDDAEGNDCDSLRSTGTMKVLDLNGVPGVGNGVATGSVDGACPGCVDGPDADSALDDYAFSDWRDVLRGVYTGQHAHINIDACSYGAVPSAISTRFCSSDVLLHLGQHVGEPFRGRRELRLGRSRRLHAARSGAVRGAWCRCRLLPVRRLVVPTVSVAPAANAAGPVSATRQA